MTAGLARPSLPSPPTECASQMKTQTTIEPCEECEGTGTRERKWDSAPLVCWNCDGRGFVEVEVKCDPDVELDDQHAFERAHGWGR
jgi:DnaJ-class molecular chaperone